MPMYDYAAECGCQHLDVYEPMVAVGERRCDAHNNLMVRALIPGSKAHSVIGDEIDVLIRHGLCDEVTGEAMRYRSREVMRKEAERRGLTNIVEHKGSDGSDKSRKTSRWI